MDKANQEKKALDSKNRPYSSPKLEYFGRLHEITRSGDGDEVDPLGKAPS